MNMGNRCELRSTRTDRLVLRAAVASDLDSLIRFHAASMEAFRPWVPAYPEGATAESMAKEQLAMAARCEDVGFDLKRIGVLENGEVIGCFNLNIISRGVFLNAYAGWSVRPDRQRQGYGAEGVRGLLRIAFAEEPHGVGLHRVQANVMPENAASKRLALSCGFRLEGEMKGYLKIAGEWRNHLGYAILRDEFEDR